MEMEQAEREAAVYIPTIYRARPDCQVVQVVVHHTAIPGGMQGRRVVMTGLDACKEFMYSQ